AKPVSAEYCERPSQLLTSLSNERESAKATELSNAPFLYSVIWLFVSSTTRATWTITAVAMAWLAITCVSLMDITSERLNPTTITGGPGNDATIIACGVKYRVVDATPRVPSAPAELPKSKIRCHAPPPFHVTHASNVALVSTLMMPFGKSTY